MRARRTRGGPRPLPEQQPGTSPPFSTPANRRKTPIEQLLRGGGRGIAVTPAKTRRGRVGGVTPRPVPRGPPHAPPPPVRPRAGGCPDPRPSAQPAATRSQGRPPSRARPGRERERGAAVAGPSLQASGRRLPSARQPAAGPARTRPDRASTPLQPLIPTPFIGTPQPGQRGGAGDPRTRPAPRGRGEK